MTMLTYTRCCPGIDIEALSSDEPVLTNFFRSSRYEPKSFACALCAVVFQFIFVQLFQMIFEKTATEASGFRTNPEAIFFGRRTLPSDIDTTLNSLISMIELPCQHLFSTRGRSELLYELEDLTLTLCLHHFLFVIKLIIYIKLN